MSPSPFELIGGREPAVALARTFYALMAAHEPALLAVHQLDDSGQVSAAVQSRFELFLVEWLGGPAEYSPQYGHPRLRMRHAHVAIDTALAEAWVRTMSRAMDQVGITGEVRDFLEERFAEVAGFLRNATPA